MYTIDQVILLKFPTAEKMRNGRAEIRNYIYTYKFLPLYFFSPDGEFGVTTALFLSKDDDRLDLILEVLETLEVVMFPPKEFFKKEAS